MRDRKFDNYLHQMDMFFRARMDDGPVFTTNVDNAWGWFHNNVDAWARQHYNCHACRHFIERWGTLATLYDGRLTSAIWPTNDIPRELVESVRTIRDLIERSAVTGVFYSSEQVLGVPETGVWTHFNVTVPKVVPNARVLMARKRENFLDVERALGVYSITTLSEAVDLLTNDTLYRSEHVLGPAVWLLKLATDCRFLVGRARDLKIWAAIAEAPEGFCHPRASMIGTLLDDLASGMSVVRAAERFAVKMHPLRYQRPVAPPKEQTIDRAEEIFSRLGITSSLERRHANVDELDLIWRPKSRKEGVFSELRASAHVEARGTRATGVSWVKFAREILPKARVIELKVPGGRQPFCGILTAVDATAPLLFQWDNPFSWYLWANGSTPCEWGLASGSWVRVNGICYSPHTWSGHGGGHHGDKVFLALEGCRDQKKPQLCLFPETLRHELREVRSVIEAYSQRHHIEGSGTACGLMLSSGREWECQLRVDGVVMRMDRWD